MATGPRHRTLLSIIGRPILLIVLYTVISTCTRDHDPGILKTGGGNKPGNPSSFYPPIGGSLANLIAGEEPHLAPPGPSQSFRPKSRQTAPTKFDSRFSKFEGKHLYRDGQSPASRCFRDFSANPEYAKEYITNLNRRLVRGDILPSKDVKTWVNDLDKVKIVDGISVKREKKLTIIDADLRTIQEDIKPQVKEWKRLGSRKNPLTGKNPVYPTEKFYDVTDMTYVKMGEGFKLRATSMRARVEIGFTDDGVPMHLEKVVTHDAIIIEQKDIVTYSIHELEDNLAETDRVYEHLFGSTKSSQKKNALRYITEESYQNGLNQVNEALAASARYEQSRPQKRKHTPDGARVCGKRSRRTLRSSGSGECAVYLNEEGEVESIHPEEFVEQYEAATTEERETLGEIARENPELIVETSDEAIRDSMREMMHVENVLDHEATVEHIDEVHNIETSIDSEPTATFEHIAEHVPESNTERVRLSHTTIAERLAVSKRVAHGIGIMSDSVGHFFLAKTIIHGIVTGDTTSLTIVGARMGYNFVTNSAVLVGGKLFKEASMMGKATKFLGKVAGPIGAAADIGISIWSLTKSVQRFNEAQNKYDRNDAIADIIVDTESIVSSVAVLALSAAFPPAAPVIAVIGIVIDVATQLFVGIYKAFNEVERINSEVPLLEGERSHVFWGNAMDWFGLRKKDYIDYLVEEKQANDFAVEQNMKFLRENEKYLGIVFPSRSLASYHGCTLTKQYCSLLDTWICWHWEDKKTIGEHCDWGRPCWPDTGHVCDSYREDLNSGYNQFECECDADAGTHTWGYPRANQFVDFSHMQSVYLDRALPKDVENYDFKCKPGNRHSMGKTVSQHYSTETFLCENAIALLQSTSNRKPDQTMLFDLEDGDDEVNLSGDDFTPNLFRMGDEGIKKFYGGGGKNQFLFDGKCSKPMSGILQGGQSFNDGIFLQENCTKGGKIDVDFVQGKLKTSDGHISIDLKRVNEISGRKEETESVTVDCDTRKVTLFGGRDGDPDMITIPEDHDCSFNVTILMDKNTHISSKARHGLITLLLDTPWKNTEVNMDVFSRKDLSIGFLAVKAFHAHIKVVSIASSDNEIIAEILSPENEKLKLHFNFDQELPVSEREMAIYFPANTADTPYIALELSRGNEPTFYHTLPTGIKQSDRVREGAKFVKNSFDINDPWVVLGGEKDDVFVLRSWPFETNGDIEIHGGDGDDTLRLSPSKNERMEIDLTDIKQFYSIENIFGVQGAPLTVKCGCDTKLVATFGGNDDNPDIVVLPDEFCATWQDTQIVAQGHTRVQIEGKRQETRRREINVIAFAKQTNPFLTLNLELKIEAQKLESKFLLDIRTDYVDWDVQLSPNPPQGRILIQLKSPNGDSIKLDLMKPDDSTLLKLPNIQFSIGDDIEAQLFLDAQSQDFKIFYSLNSTSSVTQHVTGFSKISNVFNIIGGSWSVKGGDMPDIFVYKPNRYYSLDIDGLGGENTFILDKSDDSHDQTFGVNLGENSMGYTSIGTKGSVQNIHHLLGRPNQNEIIHVGCDTKSISGRNGYGNGYEDAIYILTSQCESDPQMEIVMGTYTRVKNLDQNSIGTFSYKVEDLATSSLDILPTANNFHLVNFAFDPRFVKRISLKPNDIMSLSLTSVENLHEFKLYKESETAEYTNPIFSFHTESSVSTHLQISNDSSIAATTSVQREGPESVKSELVALPVDANVFLINVTKHRSYDYFRGFSGSEESSVNRFWLFDLQTSMNTLNGGECLPDCSNFLHVAASFRNGEPLTIDLDNNKGSIKSGDTVLVDRLENFNRVFGRDDNGTNLDKVFATCDTRAIYYAEQIHIRHQEGNADCSYNLTIQVENGTWVNFNGDKISHQSTFINSSFTYVFKEPTSFDLVGDENVFIGPDHNYVFSFKLDDLEELYFDSDEERLNYTIDGNTHSHTMISYIGHQDQFYDQPSMVTRDGFQIQVTRHGHILLSYSSDQLFPQDETLLSSIVDSIQSVASNLDVNIILQTSEQMFYFGDDGDLGARNVLQNVRDFTSYLSGGGTNNTIYEIVSLEKDVYIYPGFGNDFKITGNDNKQTIDMSDIIVPLRQEIGTKYVPKVIKQGNNLVIEMSDQTEKYPGKIVIVNGTLNSLSERLQLLLNGAIMDFAKILETGKFEWKIVPRPITIHEGYVFVISAEELEDNQKIVYHKNNSVFDVSKFNATQRGHDLYLTDIAEKVGDGDMPKFTTVVITDYFKTSNLDDHKTTDSGIKLIDGKIHNKYSHVSHETMEVIRQISARPKTIVGVRVDIPGLQVLLNNSQLIKANDEVIYHIPKWDNVVFEEEQVILNNLTLNYTP